MIIMALSKNPKPTNGRALCNPTAKIRKILIKFNLWQYFGNHPTFLK